MNYQNELARFRDYLSERVSPGTITVYTYALECWFKTLNGNRPTQEAAQAYVDRLTKAGKSASTASLRAHAIMRFFRWKGKTITLDCPTVRLGEIEYLIIDQIEKLLGDCKTVLERTLVVVLFDTAVRVNELLGLELSDINWKNGLISVVRKGGRREEVNTSAKALEALEEWLEARKSDSKSVFMGLSYYDAWAILRALGKRAGIDIHPHIFRHSRAVHMLMNGADIHVVKEHLGHKNIATTINVYGRFMAIHLKKLVPTW